jgi:DNA repair protein RecO (recombination protein O)|tara:strand:+ start:115 stop:843 length:729 start_codon:yes stop_codon:yes gene_type:complete
LIETPALVISSIKYGDSSLITTCFTKYYGLRSYLLKGILSSRKGKLSKGMFQTFGLLSLISNHKKKEGLNFINEARINKPIKSIHTSIFKSTVVIFLSEVLKSVLKEEKEKNEELYNFLEVMILWLDSKNFNPNFHLKFLIDLTRYIGFYPNTSDYNYPYFDLNNGSFSNKINSENIILGDDLKNFRNLIKLNFDQIEMLSLTKKIRKNLLDQLMIYYGIHLQYFNPPKSIKVFNDVFSDKK